MSPARKATRARKTKETDIKVALTLDGKGTAKVATGIPFLDHMVELIAVHGLMDLTIDAKGDLEVDQHHTVEDIGLVLGRALDEALGDRVGIVRYASIQPRKRRSKVSASQSPTKRRGTR